MFTLLITCVGGELSPQAIIFAQNSKKHDVRVIGVDIDDKARGRSFADQFYTVPMAESDKYIPALIKIVEKENVDLILPGSDEEALTLSKHRYAFENGNCQIACPSYETLEILCNKAETYKKLATIEGIHIPVWEEHINKEKMIEAITRILHQCDGVVVKPATARGGRDILVISNDYDAVETVPNSRELRMGLNAFLAEYSDYYTNKYPVVVMQLLEEPVYDVDMVSMEGRAYQVVSRRRVHSAAPNEGHIVLPDTKLIQMAEIVIREFNLSWLQDIDVMYDKNGVPYILEINPRPSGSFSVSVAAGIPIIDDLISLSKNMAPTDRIQPKKQQIVPFKSLRAIA